jgi:hypothetical protein
VKKVLILTPSFPPLGGPGVQRVVKFCKYLPTFGWKPFVVTIKPVFLSYTIGSNSLDKDLEEEVKDIEVLRTSTLGLREDFYLALRERLVFPFNLEKKDLCNFNHRKDSKFNLILKFLFRFPNWFSIPEEIISWVPVCVLKSLKIIRKENIDLIFSTGPPHSVHLAGYFIKKITQKKWIADFRDPWTRNSYLPLLSPKRKQVEEFLEKIVLRSSDKITVISEGIREDLQERYSDFLNEQKVNLLTNGYDEEDFKSAESSIFKRKENEKFTISYIGSFFIYHKPECFLIPLKELIEEKSYLYDCINVFFMGICDEPTKKTIKNLGLEKVVKILDYKPHKDAITYMLNSDVLLLVINHEKEKRDTYTGKIFELLRSNRPILAIVPEDGVAANLIKISQTGVVVSPQNKEKIKEVILELYERFHSDNLKLNPNWDVIRRYERKMLTKRLSEVFDEVAG